MCTENKILRNSIGLLLLVPLFAISLYAATEKVLVNIDRVIKEVDENTPCALDEWANSLDAACKCCLVKRIPLLDIGKKASEIVEECIAKGYCTKPIFEHIQKEEQELGTSEQELEKALRKLYNNSLIIKKVDTEGIQFDQYGNFTESSVGPFLERAYQEGKLPDEVFKSARCLKVKNFSEEKGVQTAQLFTIESTCKNKKNPEFYILKEMSKKYDETASLAALYGIHELDTLIWPHKPPSGYPVIVIPEAFIQYGDHYLSLMPRASGVSLESVMKNYINQQTEDNEKLVKQSYSDVGRALGKFHKKFMKKIEGKNLTSIHGDFHHKNIFYDPKTRQVSFIDNEYIAASFKKPKPITQDTDIILRSGLKLEIALKLNWPSGMKNPLSSDKWLSITVPSFFIAYINEYPKNEHKAILEEIKKGLKESDRASFYFEHEQELNKDFAAVERNI
ncbi:MAG: hypothetical protein WA432_02095 [Candidatus Babeliaceae bacterium]